MMAADPKSLFVTGATGYIGRVVVEKAIAEGYTVRGLSRNEAGDETLKALGATPVRGDLTTLDVLRHESSKAGAVLQLAYIHDFSVDYEQVLATDAAAVDALAAGVKGTGKALVLTSGSGLAEPDPSGGETDETAPVTTTFVMKDRIRSEEHALRLAKDGVRVIVIRLPPYVYGRGASFFVPLLMQMAAKKGESIYVNDGHILTTDVHVDDAATLYLRAAQKGKPGEVFNGTGSTTVTIKQMAEAIGEVLQVPARSATYAEAQALWGDFVTGFVQYQNRASNRKAVTELGWAPTGIDMLTDIRSGSYVEVAAKLKSPAS
jgi:nucleoside-diphosphate-sugar epimerase